MLARAAPAARRRPTGCSTTTATVLALRADMTVPIARVVATRYAAAEPPLRFCYVAHVYRAVRPHRGQMREFLQAGIELVGAPGAAGDGRGADRPVPRRSTPSGCATTASGWATPRCSRRCWTASTCRGGARADARRRWPRTTSSALEREVARLGLRRRARRPARPRRRSCAAAPTCSTPSGPGGDALAGCATSLDLLEPAVAERVIFDLGLVRGAGLLHGRGLRGLRPGARRAARRRRALRRPARALRPPAARGRLRARRRPRCTSRWRARSAAA